MYTISDLNKVLHKNGGETAHKIRKMADIVSLHLFKILLLRTSQAGIYDYKGNTFQFGRIKGKVLSAELFFVVPF